MADRVVVMEKGVVQQVGSPTEIYDRPANTFVAGFIGNPAMNLIAGSVAGGVFTAANTEISRLNAADQNITLGFRAEDARVVDSGGQINAPIYTTGIVGGCHNGDGTDWSRNWLAFVQIKTIGPRLTTWFQSKYPAEICHLFDGQTGARIRGVTPDDRRGKPRPKRCVIARRIQHLKNKGRVTCFLEKLQQRLHLPLY